MLTSLRLRNFRCFEGVSIDIGPGFNFFLGANGEGKTTILEAACVLLRLQSQRSSLLAAVIQIGKKFFQVSGKFEEHELEFRYSTLRRRVKFDEIEQRTLGEYLRIGRVVSLANADVELVHGGSEARRRYLDFLGAQIDGTYRPALRAYERAWRARNALLKSPVPRAREVVAYNVPLIEHGRVLLRLRIELARMLAPWRHGLTSALAPVVKNSSSDFFPAPATISGAISSGRTANQSVYVRQLSVHIATIWNCSSIIYRRHCLPRKGNREQSRWQ